MSSNDSDNVDDLLEDAEDAGENSQSQTNSAFVDSLERHRDHEGQTERLSGTVAELSENQDQLVDEVSENRDRVEDIEGDSAYIDISFSGLEKAVRYMGEGLHTAIIGGGEKINDHRRGILTGAGALLLADYTNIIPGDKNAGDGLFRGGECGWDLDAGGVYGEQVECEDDTPPQDSGNEADNRDPRESSTETLSSDEFKDEYDLMSENLQEETLTDEQYDTWFEDEDDYESLQDVEITYQPDNSESTIEYNVEMGGDEETVSWNIPDTAAYHLITEGDQE